MSYLKAARQLPKKLLNQFPEEVSALSNGSPFLDVRSPIEYAKGKIPNSVNLPILEDAERESVGKAYKQHGEKIAVEMGHNLVSGQVKLSRIQAWKNYVTQHPNVNLICWRGGLRSKIAQDWLAQSNIQVARMTGGFKTLRKCLIAILDAIALDNRTVYVIGGKTGSKKTVVIKRLNNSIDLEDLAQHRGSAFGANIQKQPTPITFENELAVKLLTHQQQHIVVEDESKTIGRLAIPDALFKKMKIAPIALVKVPIEERVDHIYNEYVKEPSQAGASSEFLSQHYLQALDRIERRLGGDRHSKLTRIIKDAFSERTGTDHQDWITALLEDYYDPMYDYQIKQKESRIKFIGSPAEVTEYLKNLL